MINFQIKILIVGAIVSLGEALTCCESKNQNPTQQIKLEPRTVAAAMQPVADCTPRMKSFLRWYLGFEARRDTSYLILNSPLTNSSDADYRARLPRGNISSTKFIQFNRRKMDVYLDSLRKSGYFSTDFLTLKRASMLRRGAEVDAEKQNDHVPEQFDYDEIFHIQELYEFKHINTLKPSKSPRIKQNASVYEFSGSDYDNFKYLLYLKNENGLCVIDSITHK